MARREAQFPDVLRVEQQAAGATVTAELRAVSATSQLRERLGNTLTTLQKRADKLLQDSAMAQRVYPRFLDGVDAATGIVASLASGEIDAVPKDVRSLVASGESPDALRTYFDQFVLYDPKDPKATYSFPRIDFPAVAVFDNDGKPCHIDYSGFVSPFSYNIVAPTFAPDVHLPALVDPNPRTFAEFAELERLDPGHARQLFDAYRMATDEYKAKGIHFQDPLVIRMVVALPVGSEYATQFLPEIFFSPEETKNRKAWDPRVVINGALNDSGNFLNAKNGNWYSNRIPLKNADGKEAFFRIERLDSRQEAEADPLEAQAQHEKNSVGIIVFPHTIGEALPLPRFSNQDMRREMDFFDAPKMKVAPNLGAAHVTTGDAGWFTADKRHTTALGEPIIPERGGRPYIFSIKFFTTETQNA